jgi:hypothetical protein
MGAGDLCRPSGPDGEGQARGQARTRAANLRKSPITESCKEHEVGDLSALKPNRSGMLWRSSLEVTDR